MLYHSYPGRVDILLTWKGKVHILLTEKMGMHFLLTGKAIEHFLQTPSRVYPEQRAASPWQTAREETLVIAAQVSKDGTCCLLTGHQGSAMTH